MTLMEAFSEHLVKGQQGQLVIKFNGDVHLCKILVEDGQAVHISHGRLAPELVIETLGSKTVEWTNFIAGYPVRKKVDFPLHEKLLVAVGEQSSASAVPAATTAAPPQATPEPVAAPAPAPNPSEATVSPEEVAEVISNFIELIGPLGTILAEQAASAVNYTAGTPMPESSFNGFLLALAKEVSDEDRNDFLARFKH